MKANVEKRVSGIIIDTKYYIDYIAINRTGENFYHQLVRSRDDAILCAYHSLDLGICGLL